MMLSSSQGAGWASTQVSVCAGNYQQLLLCAARGALQCAVMMAPPLQRQALWLTCWLSSLCPHVVCRHCPQACAWCQLTHSSRPRQRTPPPSLATLKAAGSTTPPGPRMVPTSPSQHAAQVRAVIKERPAFMPLFFGLLAVDQGESREPPCMPCVWDGCMAALQDGLPDAASCVMSWQVGPVTRPVARCSCGSLTLPPARPGRCSAQGGSILSSTATRGTLLSPPFACMCCLHVLHLQKARCA